MTKSEFRRLIDFLKLLIFDRAPKDTWNLASNALRVEWHGDDEVQIYIDESIAPYMPYTNEPWISPKWKGKQNPNEGWWQDAVTRLCLHALREELNLTEVRND